MRVFIPATFSMLQQLSDTGQLAIARGWGFAHTPALDEFFHSGDEEEISYVAFEEAARASLRLLTEQQDHFPHRRVVITVVVDDDQVELTPDMGEAVVRLSPPSITTSQLAAIHVDSENNEETTAQAIAVIDQADLGDQDAELTVGDALDCLMSWYHPQELSALVQLL